MAYFNFYAVQAKRLQALAPNKKIKYLHLDENYVFLEVDGEVHGVDRQSLRKMANLPKIAKTL